MAGVCALDSCPGLLEPYPEGARGAVAAPAGAAQGARHEPAPITVSEQLPPAIMLPPDAAKAPQGAGIGGFLADTFKVGPAALALALAAAAAGGHRWYPADAHKMHSASTRASCGVYTPPHTHPCCSAQSALGRPTGPPGGFAPHRPQSTEGGAGGTGALPAQAAAAAGQQGTSAAGGGAAGGEPGDAPVDVFDRPPRPYAMSAAHATAEAGAGEPASPEEVSSPRRMECRMPDETALGLGARGRALSAELPPPPAGGRLAVGVSSDEQGAEGARSKVMGAASCGQRPTSASLR